MWLKLVQLETLEMIWNKTIETVKKTDRKMPKAYFTLINQTAFKIGMFNLEEIRSLLFRSFIQPRIYEFQLFTCKTDNNPQLKFGTSFNKLLFQIPK